MVQVTRQIINQLLAAPIAQQAALVITFESLSFGEVTEQKFAWMNVKTVCLHCQSDSELNRWWRYIHPDAAWKTASDLFKFADKKLKELNENK